MFYRCISDSIPSEGFKTFGRVIAKTNLCSTSEVEHNFLQTSSEDFKSSDEFAELNQ